jgi:hypothetical protein
LIVEDALLNTPGQIQKGKPDPAKQKRKCKKEKKKNTWPFL